MTLFYWIILGICWLIIGFFVTKFIHQKLEEVESWGLAVLFITVWPMSVLVGIIIYVSEYEIFSKKNISKVFGEPRKV